jgi:hypothetical protein
MSATEKLIFRPWQSWLLEEIKRVNAVREENLSLSDYDLNKMSQIKIKLPTGAGQTFFTAYLSLIYPSVIVHRDVDHWEEISQYRSILQHDNGVEQQGKTTIISTFELFYATHNAMLVQPPVELLSSTELLKKRISTQSIVVADMASYMPNIVESFILNVAHGPVIFLD